MRNKLLKDFNALDLSSVKKKDLVEARIVPTILLDCGYTLKRGPSGKVLFNGPGIQEIDLCFGVYNLWFLLHWVEFSQGFGYDGLYSRTDDGDDAGGVFMRSLEGLLSNDSLASRAGSVHKPAKLGDYWSFSDTEPAECHGHLMPVARLAPNFKLRPGNVPQKTAYWKKTMDPENNQQRRTWIEFLDQHGFSYRFNPAKTELYFSNSRSASLGYPPNAELLGLPKLALGEGHSEEQIPVDEEDYDDIDFTFLSGEGLIVDVEDGDDLIESFKTLNGIVDVESDDEIVDVDSEDDPEELNSGGIVDVESDDD